MLDDEIINVRYMVKDVEESIAFYTKLLDFELLTNFSPAFADVKRGAFHGTAAPVPATGERETTLLVLDD